MCAHVLPTGYPEELKFKLLERRGKARQSLGKLEEGITDIETAIEALDKANLAKDKREGKKSELQRFKSRDGWIQLTEGLQVEERVIDSIRRRRMSKSNQSKTCRTASSQRESKVPYIQRCCQN